ncbi:hypothetical protein AMTR_s00109p00120160 [Amborella trichopoda]|uniref:Uncharacterized protein n=1 Tax=Amborella trichopoda TaxID=13333 RepID=W1NTZ0_AMBTC|nr:hypothetical protein AMTR_s00109p00120160 [Amborella trichopoda]
MMRWTGFMLRLRSRIGHPTSWLDELSMEMRDWHQRKCTVIEAVMDMNGGMLMEEYMEWYNRMMRTYIDDLTCSCSQLR